MKLYELMFIIEPDIEGDPLEEAISKVTDLLEREGASIVNLKKMGKRRLAYEINDFKEGYYVLLNAESDTPIVPSLEHFFKVTEGYLRYMVIRLDEEISKGKEADAEVEVAAEIEAEAEAAAPEEIEKDEEPPAEDNA